MDNCTEHFIIVNDWSNETESGTTILGVAHSMEEAKKIFSENIAEERAFAEEHQYEIYEDEEDCFDAGEPGYYLSNHTSLYIQKFPA